MRCLEKQGESLPQVDSPPGLVLYSMGSPIKSMISLCLPLRVTRDPRTSMILLMSFTLNTLLHMAESHLSGHLSTHVLGLLVSTHVRLIHRPRGT